MREKNSCTGKYTKGRKGGQKTERRSIYIRTEGRIGYKEPFLEDSRMKITELEQNLSSKSTIMEEKSSELAELNITLKEKEHKLSELEKK